MESKDIYSIIGIIFLIGGYFIFGNNIISKNPEAEKSSIVELKNGDSYDLVASYVTKVVKGKSQVMLAYNGSIPGPVIRVAQGAEVTINFKNNTDFPGLLHSHGVRMNNAFDGSQLQQKEIESGDSFAYKLTFPDAGVYWYHPHAKEVYGQGLGLYGAFIVTPSDTAYFPKVNREVPLFLSDVPIENGKISLDKEEESHFLMGHYGNVMLTNGEEKYSLQAMPGEVVRLYVVNSANTRTFNFSIKGLKLKLVGGDSGAYEKASFVDSVVLAPSERAIVDVLIPKTGSYEIQHKTPSTTYLLGSILAVGEKSGISYEREFNVLKDSVVTMQSIDPFRSHFDDVPEKRISLTLDVEGMRKGHQMGGGMMSGISDDIEWDDTSEMANQMSDADSVAWKIKDLDTGKENMDIRWVLKKDRPLKISILNDATSMHPMQHPIHFHGQRFLVVARNGVRQSNLVWKDTVLVKSGETVEIILNPSNPGKWMAHCHISEHLEAGMMFGFAVE